MYDNETLKTTFPLYKEKILELTRQKLYAYERYGLEFAAVMIYSADPIDMEICSASIRQSDNIYSLEENLLLVVFDMVDEESALKAAQNFLHAYHQLDIRQELYTLVAHVHQDGTSIDMGSRLFILLEYALKERLRNSVIDINLMQSKSWM